MATWTSTTLTARQDSPGVKFYLTFDGSITGTTFNGTIRVYTALADGWWGGTFEYYIYQGTSRSGTLLGHSSHYESSRSTSYINEATYTNVNVTNLPVAGGNTNFYIYMWGGSEPARYGGVTCDFGTLAQKPTLSTVSISSITRTGSNASCTVTSDGGATVTACSLKASTTSGDYSSPVSTITGSASGASGSFSSLTPNTKYYVRGEATNTAGTGYTTETNFTTSGNAPTVTTSATRSKTGATITYNATYDTNASYSSRLIEYGTTTSYGSSTTNTTLSGLTTDTTYYYRITITDNFNRSGTATGSFTTGVDNPVITNTGLTTSYTSFSFNPTVTYGEDASFGRIVCRYGLTQDKDQTVESTSLPLVISGLKSKTMYYYNVRVYDNGNRGSNDPGGNLYTQSSAPFSVSAKINSYSEHQANIGTTFSVYPDDYPTSASATVTGTGYNQTKTIPLTGTPPEPGTVDFTGLSSQTTYTVTTTVTNSTGSTTSSSKTFTTPAAAPSISSVSIVSNGTTGIDISVTASGDSGDTLQYRFSSNGGTNWTSMQTGSTYSYTGLTAGSTYNVCLEVRNGDRFVYEYYTITLPTSGSTTNNGLIQYRQEGWWTNASKILIVKYNKWLSK